MANLKISQLSAGAPAVSTDLIPIDRAGANYSLQVSDVLGLAPRVLFAAFGTSDTVAAPNNTTTAFATSYNLPANFLVANKLLRITLGFALQTTTTIPSLGLDLTIGGTTVWASTALASGNSSGTTHRGGVVLIVQGSVAPGASAAVYTHPLTSPGTSSGALSPLGGTATSQPVNLATNGVLAITPALTCTTSSPSTGNGVTLEQMIVEALN